MDSPFILISPQQWEELTTQLTTLAKEIRQLKKRPKQDYLTHNEVMKFFDVSDTTIRRWRDTGKLGFSHPSKNTYTYKWSHVQSLFDEYYHEPFALKQA